MGVGLWGRRREKKKEKSKKKKRKEKKEEEEEEEEGEEEKKKRRRRKEVEEEENECCYQHVECCYQHARFFSTCSVCNYAPCVDLGQQTDTDRTVFFFFGDFLGEIVVKPLF